MQRGKETEARIPQHDDSSCHYVQRSPSSGPCSRRFVSIAALLMIGLTQFLVVYRKFIFTQVCFSFLFAMFFQTCSCQNGSLGVSCRRISKRANDGDCLFDCYSWD
jgi:hypothetical protein